VICDWHYERADHTPVYFAMKGFRVITCTGNKPETSVAQAEDIVRFRTNTTSEMKPRYYGIMQTVWSSTDQFIDAFYGKQPAGPAGRRNPADGFKALYTRINELEQKKP